jgi:glycine hydroxymethyltransferase
MENSIKKVIECVESHNRWRREECLNMIASESVMSPLAEKFFVSDFEGRYNEHDVELHYRGTKYSYEIEELCNQLFRERFKTKYADVRPISGAIANLIIYTAFLRPGDVFLSLGIMNGAHVSSSQWGIAGGALGLRSVDMFFDIEKMNIDVDKTVELVKHVNPKLMMFGASVILFPEPIEEIKKEIDPKIKIVYDAAHVLGLIYNGVFQDPLKEGADIMTSSTHKTFQGPQGGVIIGNKNLAEEEWEKVQRAIFPKVLSNTHIHRFPSLAITALEMNEFGEEYARQVVKNSKALGEALYNKGFKVLCPDLGFTECHQLLVDVKEFGGGDIVAKTLEKANIITNKIALPYDKPQDAVKNPSGIRIGTQELTRWGMKEDDMKEVAEFYKKVLIDKEEPEEVKKEVIAFKKEFNTIHYCFK